LFNASQRRRPLSFPVILLITTPKFGYAFMPTSNRVKYEVLRGTLFPRSLSLASEDSSDEDSEDSGDSDDGDEKGRDRRGAGQEEGRDRSGRVKEKGKERKGSKSNVFLNMMAAARGKKFNKRHRRGNGGEFDKKEARRQKQVLICSLTSLCLPGSEIELVEERRQKQSGFHLNAYLLNPSQSVVASRPSGSGANDSRIRARSN
jgi:hypothetical protein